MALVVSAPQPQTAAATFTGSWSSNVTYTGTRYVIGDRAYYEVTIACSGAPTSASLTITIPSGDTINTAKLTNTATDGSEQLGYGTILDGGTANYPCSVKYASTTTVSIRYQSVSGSNVVDSTVTQAAPITFGNTDKVMVKFDAPIS